MGGGVLLAVSPQGRCGVYLGFWPGGRGLPAGSEVSHRALSGVGVLGMPGLPVQVGPSGLQMDPADSGRCVEDTSPS